MEEQTDLLELLRTQILPALPLEGDVTEIRVMKAGHINRTYRVLCQDAARGETHSYVVQRINTAVFRQPEALMDNVSRVTDFIRDAVRAEGGDTSRCTLHFLRARDGKMFVQDSEDGYWRAYDYIDHCVAYDRVEKPEHFTSAGVALGRFQKLLSAFPAEELAETIPNFHNTVSRIADFKEFVRKDASGRAKDVRREIEFVLERESICSKVLDAIADGSVPVRVTHNDTKLNNVLMDDKTGEVLCLIDLDTVMPGSALYDFGDSIRFGASSADEDERDLDRVHFVPQLFDAYAQGYLREARGILTPAELELLPFSAILMTLECGMRFLGDHIDGDRYFSIAREGQNLDRARTQLKLVAEMEAALRRGAMRLPQ